MENICTLPPIVLIAGIFAVTAFMIVVVLAVLTNYFDK